MQEYCIYNPNTRINIPLANILFHVQSLKKQARKIEKNLSNGLKKVTYIFVKITK